MTEYKKLVALTEELSKDVDLLVSEHQARSIGDATEAMDSSTIDSLFVTACRIREAVSGGAPRILKILTKARETDPNRQIYNENMCAKIEDLFVAFTDNIYKLLYGGESHIDNEEAVDEGREEIISCILEGREVPLELSAALASIENAHDLALLERAANEAWASRIAGDMTQHVLFEQQGRQVLLAEEKQARLFLVEEKRKDKKALMDVGRLFQELKWCAESHRRATERLWLCEAVHAVPVESVAALLRARLPGEELRRTVSRNIGALCSALLTRPEDPNIRRLRCNNQHLIEDYGHCSVATCPGDQSCRVAEETGEILWGVLGYAPAYTGESSWGVETLLRAGTLRNARLPCGQMLSDHSYTPVGYEDYAERMFELREPDAASQPDKWMEWFDRVGQLLEALRV